MVELSDEEFKEVLSIFRTESEELILNIGKLLLKLEKEPKNNELIDELLRELHTLKGSSGMLGFTKMQELSHNIEDVLKLVREKELPITNNSINVIFEALDLLTAIRDIRVQGEAPEMDLGEVKHKLSLLMGGKMVDFEQQFDDDGKSPRERVVRRMYSEYEEDRELRQEEVEKYQKIKSAIEDLSKDFDDAITEQALEVKKGYSGVIKTIPSLKMDDTIKVSSEDIDNIIEHVEQLEAEGHVKKDELEKLRKELLHLRLVKFSKLFDLFPRLVRDLARTLGKDVELQTYGGEEDVEKSVLEKLKDPLVHLMRNSVDHGIEKPMERQILGKSRRGLITISAERDHDYIVEISDDGKGINRENIKKKILEKKMASQDKINKMSDSELLQFLFQPGFSTSQDINVVSGRGIGLDVVKKNIEKLGGKIEIETTLEKGTKITLRIPVKL